MKHYLPNSLRALFLSLAVLLSLPMLAVKVTIDGIRYDLVAETKQATVIQKSSGKYSGEVVIPESVEHEGTAYSVTSIGSSTFSNCSGLTLVTISNSVTSIGDNAFQNCSGLTSVTIPNSVMSIGSAAFWLCSGLTSVHISDIAAWCNIEFQDWSSNPLYEAQHLYLNGEEVRDLVIPNGVTSIGSEAFDGCTGLTSVTIPKSVTSIGGWAFYGCTGLTSVHISDIAAWYSIDFKSSSANPLGEAHHLYLNGEEVKDLVIPNGVTSIGKWTFNGCTGLASVTIPNGVTSIGEGAFFECSGLPSVTIPNSVDSIGDAAFSGCKSLTSVTIPNGVTSIGSFTFDGCSGLTSVIIPNSVTSIGYRAFSGCSGLTSVTIPNSVTSIGSYAFEDCSALTSVTIPNSVENIGEEAFRDCSSLASITIGNGVTNIGRNAFANTAWSNEQPDGLLYLDSWLIGYNGDKPTGEISINQGTKAIAEATFSDCSGLTSVAIPNSVTSIVSYAFEDCSGLTSVTIGNSVTSIGSSAFYGCSGLTSVTIPNSVTSIGSSAFYGCSGLTSVHISDFAAWCNIDFGSGYSNPLFYAHHLYLNGEEVKDLVIPNSVTSIGDYAFYGCSGLTSVTIPNSVLSIGEYAFSRCSGLTSVTIPNSVTSIEAYTFSYCSGLTSVTIPNSVTSIGERPFSGCSEFFDVYCYAENVPVTNGSLFSLLFSYRNTTLHVPAASIDSYKATWPWNRFGKIVALTPEETGIGELKGENGTENSAVYDLSGRRVQKAQKGIFIQNGKVVVK